MIVAEAENGPRTRGASSIYLQADTVHEPFSHIPFYDKLGYRFKDMVLLGKVF